MAVAVQMDFEGATLDQYDQVCQMMGLTPKGPGPAGAIFDVHNYFTPGPS